MPQHTKRIKIRRKDLRKPDEFETLTRPSARLGGEARALVLGVAGPWSSWHSRVWRSHAGKPGQRAAAVAFRAAQSQFDAARYRDAAGAFAEVASGHPTRRRAARRLYRAHALARQGDAAGAATAYGEYLATSPDAEYLRQEALTGLARPARAP